MSFHTAFSWGRWLDSGPRGGKPHGPGRRVHVRYVCDLLGMCKPAGSDLTQTLATLVNVSRGGVGLLVSEPFGKGAVLSLKAPLAGGTFLVCVAHVSMRKDGRRRLGCVFIDQLNADALRGFWNREVGEQRSSERFLCEGVAWYRRVGTGTRRRQAIVFDISAMGAFLVANRPVPEGAALRLELCAREARPVRTLGYVVRRQSLTNKKWTFGCTFIRALTASDVSALLGRKLPGQPST